MNLESLRAKLLAAARANPPSDRVPYAFEQRILARLDRPLAAETDLLWTQMLWRAAGPCVAVSLLVGVWAFTGAGNSPGSGEFVEAAELSADLEETMLAGVTALTEELW